MKRLRNPASIEEDQYTEIAIKTQLVLKHFTIAWNGETMSDLGTFKQHIANDPVIRKIFILCLQEKRADQQFALEPQTFTNIVQISSMMLDVVDFITH